MIQDFRIEKLRRDHPLDGFSCGRPELDRFLKRFAFANQQAHASQTYLARFKTEVIGFYSLVVGHISYDDAPERLTKGLAHHPVPIMLLARLAVQSSWQGRRIGAYLLRDAMLRTLQAADIVGIRAFVVHAKDPSSRAFYEHFGFERSFTDPFHLFLLTKDIKHSLEF